jgi:hypothetical protein
LREGKGNKQPQAVGDILGELLQRAGARGKTAATALPEEAGTERDRKPSTPESSGRFDFDLAEFPLFHFCTRRLGGAVREPLTYADTIVGKDGRTVPREWTAYPGPFGYGGPSTQVLLYDLLQLYAEQGCRGSQIQFGTLRSLFLRRGHRNPSKGDYLRLRRDIDILRGYDFHCKNAFWDRERQAYVDMHWRLFGSVFYFQATPSGEEPGLPFGFIEVSPVLEQIARTRGFFALGFDSQLFHGLKPLEQRLAVYLAKKFLSQKLHRRFVDDLARALPIGATRERDRRQILRQAAQGLLDKGLPLLASFRLARSRNGKWLAEFSRNTVPSQVGVLPRGAAKELAPGVAALVDRIVEATGNGDDRLWWGQCARRLGQGAVDRALGQLKEARQRSRVRSPAALLTKIFKDIATEAGVALQ